MSSRESFESPEGLGRAVWRFLTRGPLFYLTVPLALIAMALAFTASMIEGGSKLAFALKDLLSEKTSYLSKHELEVINEWVALVDYADTYDQAVDRSRRFTDAYKGLDDIWKNNILFVRDPLHKDRWAVVVDLFPGSSSCDDITMEIRRLQQVATQSRESEDTLGMWLYGSVALEYRLDHFQATYGRVTNLPVEIDKHSRNPNGACSSRAVGSGTSVTKQSGDMGDTLTP